MRQPRNFLQVNTLVLVVIVFLAPFTSTSDASKQRPMNGSGQTSVTRSITGAEPLRAGMWLGLDTVAAAVGDAVRQVTEPIVRSVQGTLDRVERVVSVLGCGLNLMDSCSGESTNGSGDRTSSSFSGGSNSGGNSNNGGSSNTGGSSDNGGSSNTGGSSNLGGNNSGGVIFGGGNNSGNNSGNNAGNNGAGTTPELRPS